MCVIKPVDVADVRPERKTQSLSSVDTVKLVIAATKKAESERIGCEHIVLEQPGEVLAEQMGDDIPNG